MILITRKFRLSNSRWMWTSGCTWLRTNRLAEFFEIPGTTRTIWMSLHTRPAANRIKVACRRRTNGKWRIIPSGDRGSCTVVAYVNLPSKALRGDAATLYAQVEYKE